MGAYFATPLGFQSAMAAFTAVLSYLLIENTKGNR